MKKPPKDVDGRNGERAYWAATALSAYLGRGPDKPGDIEAGIKAWQELTKSDDDTVITDLLCDLHHWCDLNSVNFEEQVAKEQARGAPDDTTAQFMRALRRWGRKSGYSYAEGIRMSRYHYDAETGKAPY
jgi:hypothetical protein